MNKNDLIQFLDNFNIGIESSNKDLYKKIIEGSELTSFSDYEEFYFLVLYPFKNFLEGFLLTEVSDNRDVLFIMLNSQFIERHFNNTIEKEEGMPCCSDKSRTIMYKIIKFYTTGEKISFDFDGEYTYHIPKNVFTTHDQIILFYEGLKELYYGRNEKYLFALKFIYGKVR